jgi:hypothetical protein
MSAAFSPIMMMGHIGVAALVRELPREAQLFPHSNNRIADRVDGALQLAFCHAQMFEPAANFGFIIHGDVAAVALALAGKNIAHNLFPPGLNNQTARSRVLGAWQSFSIR